MDQTVRKIVKSKREPVKVFKVRGDVLCGRSSEDDEFGTSYKCMSSIAPKGMTLIMHL